jgi:uncharacterized repeat protein (TIGR01451 family)
MNKISLIVLIAVTTIPAIITGCKKGTTSVAAASSDRKISITVDKNTPAIGTNVTFTLIAGNDGPDEATDINVSNALPTGYTFISASATSGAYGAGIWNGFGLAKGGTATLIVVATVNATGTYVNTATISGKENDPVAGNNRATATTAPTASTGRMVSTLAGSNGGYIDGMGTAAKFSGPKGLVMDPAGNIYVVDHSNDRIRKITPAGLVSTLAGSVKGFADGMGATAKFNGPNDIAIDASGNLYVSDGYNNRIRKIIPSAGGTGMVSTLAGDAGNLILYQPMGLDLDAAGNVYVADWGHDRIRKITPGGVVSTFAGCDNCLGGYVDGPGTAARFYSPTGVAVDATGNVYVTEAGNHLVRKITPAGVVSTFAGSGEGFADGTGAAAKLYKPISPAIDAAGNIYLADAGNNRIRKIIPSAGGTGVVSTLTVDPACGNTDGPIATALICNPLGVAIDAAGNLYFSDTNNERIRKISAQ